MKELDCRKLACPQPVLNTKDALDEHTGGPIKVIVDNPAARDNVTRFATSQGCQVQGTQDGDDFILTITREGSNEGSGKAAADATPNTASPRLVVKVSNRFMGTGDEELGRILMTAFLKSISEATQKPAAIVFYNTGVYLTCEGSDCLEAIKTLEKMGTEVFSCGTCLDFFNKKEELRVGVITNMFEIIETLAGADRVVSP